jgi:hypothetical protein
MNMGQLTSKANKKKMNVLESCDGASTMSLMDGYGDAYDHVVNDVNIIESEGRW